MPFSQQIIYLHGFASGPLSRKAQFFREKLREEGYEVVVPDLAGGNFEHLTISGQLQVIEELVGDQPVVLIGSSLGGYLAALYAATHKQVSRLLLLAPAFDFLQLWVAALGPERLREWREQGAIPVFHYGEGREVPLRFNFLQDAENFPPFPDFHQPALIIHGNQDSVVPVEVSIAFTRCHPQARLMRVESGHELTDVLEEVWEHSRRFLVGSDV